MYDESKRCSLVEAGQASLHHCCCFHDRSRNRSDTGSWPRHPHIPTIWKQLCAKRWARVRRRDLRQLQPEYVPKKKKRKKKKKKNKKKKQSAQKKKKKGKNKKTKALTSSGGVAFRSFRKQSRSLPWPDKTAYPRRDADQRLARLRPLIPLRPDLEGAIAENQEEAPWLRIRNNRYGPC